MLMSVADAVEAGFVRAVTVTTATDEMYGLIKLDAQLDDTFQFYELETSENWSVKGHLAEVNDADLPNYVDDGHECAFFSPVEGMPKRTCALCGYKS